MYEVSCVRNSISGRGGENDFMIRTWKQLLNVSWCDLACAGTGNEE